LNFKHWVVSLGGTQLSIYFISNNACKTLLVLIATVLLASCASEPGVSIIEGSQSSNTLITPLDMQEHWQEEKNVTTKATTEFVNSGEPVTKQLHLTLSADEKSGINGKVRRTLEQQQIEQTHTITEHDVRTAHETKGVVTTVFLLAGTTKTPWRKQTKKSTLIPTGAHRKQVNDVSYSGPVAVRTVMTASGAKKQTINTTLQSTNGSFQIQLGDLVQKFGQMPRKTTIAVSVEEAGLKRQAEITLGGAKVQHIVRREKELVLERQFAAAERKLKREQEEAEEEADREQERQEEELERAQQALNRSRYASSSGGGDSNQWVHDANAAIKQWGDETIAGMRKNHNARMAARRASDAQNERYAQANREQQQRFLDEKRELLESNNERRQEILARKNKDLRERMARLKAENERKRAELANKRYKIAVANFGGNGASQQTGSIASSKNAALPKKRAGVTVGGGGSAAAPQKTAAAKPRQKTAKQRQGNWVPEALAVCWQTKFKKWICEGPTQKTFPDDSYVTATSNAGCKTIRRSQPFRNVVVKGSTKWGVLLFCDYGAGARKAPASYRDIAHKYGFALEIADTRRAYYCPGKVPWCKKSKALKVARYADHKQLD